MPRPSPLWSLHACAALALCSAACAPAEPVAPRQQSEVTLAPSALVLDDAHAWQSEGTALDCATGVSADDDVFRVETGLCRYGSWAAPLPGDVDAGARLRFSWWHDMLISDDGGHGHLAVAVGDAPVVDVEVAIPAFDDFAAVDVEVPAAPAGTPVRVHLHNHGANHWGLSALTFSPPAL